MFDNPLVLTVSVIVMALLFSIVISFMYAGLYTLVRPLTQKMSHKGKSIAIQLCAIASPIVTLVSIFVFFFPSAFSMPTFYGHCHLSECEPHVPAFFESGSTVFSIMLFAFIFVIALLILIFKEQAKLSNKIDLLINLMSDSSTKLNDKSIEMIDASMPLLLNVGVLRPRIIVSRSVLQSLSDKEFQVLMMYELNRCKRYHNLQRLIAKVGTWIWPAFAKKMLLEDLSHAAHGIVRQSITRNTCIEPIATSSSKLATLPAYVNTLLEAVKRPKAKSNAPEASVIKNERNMINKIGLTFFSIQYFALMILITSAMHFLSERFL